MKQKLTYNKYDTFLFILVVSTIYGRYGLLIPSSFVIVFFTPQVISNLTKIRLKRTSYIIIFLLFWIFYAFTSYLWAPDKQNAWVSLFMLILNSMSFLEILVFSMKANNPIKTLATAWVCAFLLTSAIALWEIGTGHHLSSAREEDLYMRNAFGDYLEREYASTTFYNPNTYCFYICIIFPFALYLFSNSKKRIQALLYSIPLFLMLFVMSKNSSRGGLLTLAIMLAIFVFYKMKNSSLKGKLLFAVVLLVFGMLMVIYGDILFRTLFFRMEQKGLLEDNARIILWLASFQAILNSNGLGVGAGGMMSALEASEVNIYDIYYCHNILLEILLEYGVLIAIGFTLFLIKLYKYGIKIYDYRLKAVVLGSVLSFPFYSIINSENIRYTFLWMFFATIYTFSIRINKKTESSKLHSLSDIIDNRHSRCSDNI